MDAKLHVAAGLLSLVISSKTAGHADMRERVMERLLNQLKETDETAYEVFVISYGAHRSIEEVAAEMKLSQSQVERKLNFGREWFKRNWRASADQ